VFFGIPAIWRFVMGTTRRGTSASGNVDSSESTSTESSATKLTRKQALFVVAVYGAITTAVGISVVIWMFPSSNDGGAPRIDLRAEPHVLDLPLPASPELITKSYKPRVYRIEVTFTEHVRKQGLFGTYVEEGNAGGLGSGVLIANDPKVGILVTNRHVIDPGHNDFNRWATDLTIKVRNPLDTQWTRARVAAVHRTYDLALLLVERNFERSEVIKIAGQVVQGEQAVAIGNPEGIEFLTSTGIISGKLPNGMISTTCPISQGSSGGPLILIRHGYLAGITTSSFPSLAAQNLNSAVPATATVDGERTSGWTRERAAKDFEKAQRLVKLVPVMEE
jgi:S1-C subfamily serine protease